MQRTALTKIYLARHGESIANQQKLISGQMDTPLSDKGRQQAQWLSDVLNKIPLSAIYTSTLQRSVQTAAPTAALHGIEISQLDAFKEKHFGHLQGCAHQQNSYIESITSNLQSTHILTDGGEDEAEFSVRINTALDHLLATSSGSALIVGHRKTNEVILGRLLAQEMGKPLNRSINIKNKYVYELGLAGIPTINTIRLGGEFHGKKFSGIKDD